jgi:hypothetical protein
VRAGSDQRGSKMPPDGYRLYGDSLVKWGVVTSMNMFRIPEWYGRYRLYRRRLWCCNGTSALLESTHAGLQTRTKIMRLEDLEKCNYTIMVRACQCSFAGVLLPGLPPWSCPRISRSKGSTKQPLIHVTLQRQARDGQYDMTAQARCTLWFTQAFRLHLKRCHPMSEKKNDDDPAIHFEKINVGCKHVCSVGYE